MILELAEGPRRKKPQSRYITVDAYKRKSTVQAHKRRRPVLNSGDNHIYVPPHMNDGVSGVWIREDKFDGLSEGDWDSLMEELLEYQPGMSELAAKGKWKARRAEKKKQKKDKWERRQKRRDLRTSTKAQKRLMKGQKNAAGGDQDQDGGSSGGGSILDNIINKGTELIDKVKSGGGGGGGGGSQAPDDGSEPNGSDTTPPKTSDDTFDIFGMQVPKMAAYGGGALLLAGGIYLATRKK
jgi:hypothetical protein